MRFSIVIPAYNYGHLLARAVESACTQPGDDYEVLVIDDGSTDDTPAVLESLCSRYHNLRSVRQVNAGAGAARNAGVAMAAGKLILFLDADDELLPGALDEFRQALEQNPAAEMLIAPMVSVFPDGAEKTAKPPVISEGPERRFLDYLYKKLRLSNGAVMTSRALLLRFAFNPALRQAEDIPVFAQCLAAASCAAIATPVVKIHKHPASRRHAADAALSVGMGLVDEVFNPERLARELMCHRERYFARRALSLFRLLYRRGFYSEARGYFMSAWNVDSRQIWSQPSLLVKFVRCLLS